jgi:hypothetical protein
MPKTATAARPRFSESLHVLIDLPTRELIVGLAAEAAEQAGPDVRLKEGEQIRDLLRNALDDFERTSGRTRTERIRAKGRKALEERAAAARQAGESVPAEPAEA